MSNETKRAIIGLGSNLEGPDGRTPRENLEAALVTLADAGIQLIAASSWYESAPVPPSDQPWFVNGVVLISTELSPTALLKLLHKIERDFGRVRRVRFEARVLDLDLLDYAGEIHPGPGSPVRWPKPEIECNMVLPHPALHERMFVLKPLAEILPGWCHPVFNRTVGDLCDRLENPEAVHKLS